MPELVMTGNIRCEHCGAAIEVPECVLAQGLAAVAEFDAACARDCRDVAALEDGIKCSEMTASGISFAMGFAGESPECRQAADDIYRAIVEAKSRIEELECRMGHRLPEFRRNMTSYRYCPCCQGVLTVPEAVCMQGEDAVEAFLARCAKDCREGNKERALQHLCTAHIPRRTSVSGRAAGPEQ